MLILGIDQGTTGTTTVLMSPDGKIIKKAYCEITQYFPQPGWVEHDPDEIWKSVQDTISEVLADNTDDIVGVGITNQRETTLVWDKHTGKPIHKAIVWQCRRTESICKRINEHKETILEITGLELDAYFSVTKLMWLQEKHGEFGDTLLFGNINTWIIWKLTSGKDHVTDHTNAHRTMLYDLRDHNWSEELLKISNIPSHVLPELKQPREELGEVQSIPELNGTKILSSIGDQQSALFGQKCFKKGSIKNTYGTGCFMVMALEKELKVSKKGLLTTISVGEDLNLNYAFEGSVFIGGAAIQWLRDQLGIITSASETEEIANQIEDNGDVYFVPCFSGVGTPYWDMNVRGLICGLSRDTNKVHLVRAALEGIAYQCNDVMGVMVEDAGTAIQAIVVDGGATKNELLMQFQADISDVIVNVPEQQEATVLGACYLAGLNAGVWKSVEDLPDNSIQKQLTPAMPKELRAKKLEGWEKAMKRVLF